MTIIGITGRMGAGQTAAAEYLRRRYCLPIIAMGDLVREIADIENLPPTRTNLNDVSKRYAAEYGPDFFARRVLDKAEALDEPVLAVTGIRTLADVVAFRDLVGDDFVLIHVETTAPATRFERLRARGLERDPESLDAFLRMDAEEDQRFRIAAAIREADRTIRNDGTLADLHEQIEQVIVQSLLARIPVG